MEKTIAAISTGAAPGGIGIVRISGEKARTIADTVFRAAGKKKIATMPGYTAAYGMAVDKEGAKIDDVIALVFAAPKSFTGEDVVELSCHGGLFVTKKLLRAVLEAGAVPAEAGEFTKRAFLNGKMDLIQAEAVMQVINASGEQAAKQAIAGGTGVLSKKMEEMKARLTDTAAHLSAWADFPDEDIPQVDEEKLKEELSEAEKELGALLKGFDKGKILREGVTTVIAGRANAGKSTLMNVLSGCERSIVTQYEGTTRDIVEESVIVGGIPLYLADTAGIRKTEDPVEQIGVAAAKTRIKSAQLVLAVFDASRELDVSDFEMIEELQSLPAIAVVNKTDLMKVIDETVLRSKFTHVVSISAATGEGLHELEIAVAEKLGTVRYDPSGASLYTERQKQDAGKAYQAVKEASEALRVGVTLDAVTVCVEDALEALCSLTGERVSDEIIGQVFEQFCVGK